jgi:RimJ/RimL family protein N-acetyltransferase
MDPSHAKYRRARDFSMGDLLKDGTRVTIRALHPTDRPRLVEAFRLLDRDSLYTRFFTHRSGFSAAEVDRAINVDFVNEVALLVTTETARGETVIASGRYVVVGDRAAELAFVVEEDYQGRGIASRLLATLAALARAQGVVRFEADVLARNTPMIAVFKRSGLPMRRRREGDVIRLTLALDADAGGAHEKRRQHESQLD